ncbi:hypothetical protein X975_13036, partial [Stegodyphus mimosarum]
ILQIISNTTDNPSAREKYYGCLPRGSTSSNDNDCLPYHNKL